MRAQRWLTTGEARAQRQGEASQSGESERERVLKGYERQKSEFILG